MTFERKVAENTGLWKCNKGGLFGHHSPSSSGVDQIGLLRSIPPHDILIGGILSGGK